MKPLGSLAALLAAIRDDAAAEAEAITRDADAAIARLTGDAAGCPSPGRDDAALATARERARVRVAQEDWEDARHALAAREEWIAKAVASGARLLAERQPIDRTRTGLAALASEAMMRLPPGTIEIVVAEADAVLLDRDWCATIAPDNPDRVRIVSGPVEGGCLARSVDGRASFDNTYDARAERLQASWRAELANLYEQATSHLQPHSTSEAS